MELAKVRFKWGKPKRLSDRSMGVVVPILREGESERNYAVLEEVKDKVEITDSGRIGEVSVRSRADRPVFMRGGTLLKGQGTQSRVVTCGTVVMPEREEVIKRGKVAVPVPVACVHSSHPISTGTGFDVVGKSHAPRAFLMYMRGPYTNQSMMWSAIGDYSRTAAESGVREVSNNLIHTMERVDEFKRDIEGIIKKVPREENQVGMLVFDEKGVVGIELFDHPDSWKALVEAIAKSYADVLAREDKEQVFEVRMERVIEAAMHFWERLKRCKDGEVLFECEGARTVYFSGDGIAGEYTMIGATMIHGVATRVEKPETERRERITFPSLIPSARERIRERTDTRGWEEPMYTRYTTTSYLKPSTQALMSYLAEPITWTEISRKAPFTPPTVSSGLKDLKKRGFVEKVVRPNGRGAYHLTDKGRKLLKVAYS